MPMRNTKVAVSDPKEKSGSPGSAAWLRRMDIKDRRHRSLTRGRCGKQCRYTSSSLDSEDCRVPTQKSYSSSETLKAYDHDSRMHYGNRVSDLVHRESDEFPRQDSVLKRQLKHCYGKSPYGPYTLIIHQVPWNSFPVPECWVTELWEWECWFL